MNIDLSQAMQDAANRTTAKPMFAAGPVLQRIRRRRTAIVTGQSAVGVAAAGAVAFGGVQLFGDGPPPPAPPATSAPVSPSPSAEPSPTPERPPLAVVPAGPFSCGAPVPTLDDPAGSVDLHLEPNGALVVEGALQEELDWRPLDGLTVERGARLAVDALLVNGTLDDVPATTSGTPGFQMWLVQDGVVVGTLTNITDPPTTAGKDVVARAGGVLSQPDSGGIAFLCEAEHSDGTAPAGDYDLYLEQTLTRVPGTEQGTLTVAGGPYALTVTEEDDVASADPHPDLAELVVSTSGLGPLTVGLAPEGNPGAAMIEWDPVACDVEGYEGDPGRWVASGYPDDLSYSGDPRPPFSVATDGSLTRIDVFGSSIRTAEGLGVRSTVAELQTAYPGLQGPFDGTISRVWWISDTSGTLVFETQGDADGLRPAGTPESVILIRVLAPGLDPAFATANSGDVAGTCM